MKSLVILIALIATSPAASYFYDGADRLTQVAYEQGSGIRYTYDPSDNLTSVENIPLPIAPTDLAVERNNPNQATLTWTDASSNETGFVIMRRSVRDFEWETLATLGANQSIYTDNSAVDSENYVYRILALGAEGQSAHSNESVAAGEGSETFTIRDPRLTEDGNRLEFSFDTDQGATYVIETSATLESGTWRVVSFSSSLNAPSAEQSVVGNGQQKKVYVDLPPADATFYRVTKQ